MVLPLPTKIVARALGGGDGSNHPDTIFSKDLTDSTDMSSSFDFFRRDSAAATAAGATTMTETMVDFRRESHLSNASHHKRASNASSYLGSAEFGTSGTTTTTQTTRPSLMGAGGISKIDIISPSATLSHTITVKMGQFCTEKLVQGRKRLVKLYGRQKEIDTLLGELDRVCSSSGGRSLILLSGLSGEGKTALALQVRKPSAASSFTTNKAFFFVSGKFDLAQAGEPYSGIKEAMRQLCKEIDALPRRSSATTSGGPNATTTTTTKTFEDLQETIAAKLDWEMNILCQMIPELEILFSNDKRKDRMGAAVKQKSANSSFQQITEQIRKLHGGVGNNKSAKNMLSGSTASRASAMPFRARGSAIRSLRTSNHLQRANSSSANTNIPTTNNNRETSNARSASDRLCYALRKLVNVVSSFLPLVILCDDVQWADSASISLLQGWITDDENPALMLLWTYRSNLVNNNNDDGHAVSKAIANIQRVANDRSIVVTPISVGTLQEVDITELIADMLNISTPTQEKEVAELASLIYKKTLGNVFFCIQYLLSLAQRGLLSFNMGISQWSWDVEAVREGLTATETVVDLMKDKLERSPAARRILPLAACIGATFDVWVLQELMQGIQAAQDRATTDLFSSILGCSVATEDFNKDHLSLIENDGLIEAIGASSYAFIHDKVNEGALSLVAEEKLDVFKFHMGRILFSRLQELEEHRAEQIVFLVVNLLNSRLDMIPEDQRIAVCEINIAAGDEAYLSAAYRRAASYYSAAISLLPENHWEMMYTESLRLYTFAAEAEMCLGNYGEMKAYTDIVFRQNLPILDTLPIHQVHLDALGANVELTEAWTECQKVLKMTGCTVPDKRIGTRTTIAVTKVKMNKKAYQPETLSKLPISEDPLDEEISKLHDRQIIYSIWCNPQATPLTILLAYKRILKRGITRYSAPVLAWFGFLICAVFQDFKWSQEHVEFVYSLVNRFKETRAVQSRVEMVFNIFVNNWTTPIHMASKRYITGYSRGMETCDMDSAFWCAHFYHEAGLHSGTNLALLEKDANVYGKQMLDYGVFKHLHCHQSIWQLILNLRGLSNNTTILTGSAQDEEAAIQMTNENGDLHHLGHIQKDRLFGMAIFGEWEQAAKLGCETIEMICSVLASQHAGVVSRFITAVACFEMARRDPPNKKKYLPVAKSCMKIMERWFAKGDPNAQHYALFLQAEKAAYKGKTNEAISLYDRTILLAARTGYNHDQALACERLSSLYARTNRMGDDATAYSKQYLEDAHKLYHEWGATKKVELLDAQLLQQTTNNNNSS